MFIETHKKRNGSFVNDEARTIGFARLESRLEGTLNALKDYMISKDGGVPKQFSTLFSPQPEPADSENNPVSPVDIRGSSVDNNTNQQSTA
ncbi:hypothetical protein KY289_011133 [Solanum tuberosum]|nr:hypothetical protein KY289_011133 [Solanum tuberosum]